MATLQLDSNTYGLNSNMKVTWKAFTYTPISMWICASATGLAGQRWALIYSTKTQNTFTVNLGNVKNSSAGNPLAEGASFVVIATDSSGGRGVISDVFSITTSDLSLGKVLNNGNFASTDIDMLDYALDSSDGAIVLKSPLSIDYPLTNNPSCIGYTHYYFAFQLTIPDSQNVFYGCTPVLPPGIYSLSSMVNAGGLGVGTNVSSYPYTSPTVIADGATTGGTLISYTLMGSATWPGPGGGSVFANSSDKFNLTSPACLVLGAYIDGVSNANQAVIKFIVVRIG